MPRYRPFKASIAGAVLGGTVAAIPSMALAAEYPLGTQQPPVTIEHIDGSDVSRIILTARAAERLDIQTDVIREQPVQRWRTLRGEVVATTAPPEAPVPPGVDAGLIVGGVANVIQTAAASPLSIQVRRDLDVQAIGQQQLANVLVVVADDDDDDDEGFELTAELVDDDDGPDDRDGGRAGQFAGGMGRESQPLHYTATIPQDVAVSLRPGDLVEVKVPLSQDNASPKVVAYSSVLYDTEGVTWVYTNPEPLVFVRERITIAFIEGDLAILSEGPQTGTQVVTVGASLLLGAEFEIGH